MKRMLRIPAPAAIAVTLLLLLFVAFKCEATEVEAGATYTSGFNGGYAISVIERLPFAHIDLGVTLISEQTWEQVYVRNNGNVWFAFVAERPARMWKIAPSEVTVGMAHWITTQSPINGCQDGFALGFKYRFKDFSVGWRHWSNAGSCPPNRGQDMLTFGWRFQ